MFGEPERTSYDLHFSLFGMPVRVHPLFWLITVMMHPLNVPPIVVLIWVLAVFVGILAHEVGHALVMRHYGFQPSIILYGMGGLAVPGGGRGWGSRSHGAGPQILISLAGPCMGFALAAVVFGGIAAAGYRADIFWTGPFHICPQVMLEAYPRLSLFLSNIAFISVFWGFVNLLPVYPLDGGQVARELLLTFNPRDGISQSLLLSAMTGALMAVYGFVNLGSFWIALLFGYLAYQSFSAFLAYRDNRF